MYSIDQLLGPSGGGQYAGTLAAADAMAAQAAPGDPATPTPSTAGTPGASSSKAGEVAQNPTTWLVATLGLGLALYWYGTGNLKIKL